MAYIVRADIEDIFEQENVKKWADLNNDGVDTFITARIASALTYGEDTVNDLLRGGVYTIPFVEPVVFTITEITAVLAGIWLYESRGTADIDPDTDEPRHMFSGKKKEAMRRLKEIHDGVTRLDLAHTCLIPAIVSDD